MLHLSCCCHDNKTSVAADDVNNTYTSHMILFSVAVVVVMVDAADKRAREQLHPDIVSSLRLYSHLPSLLVLNKVTTIHTTC